MMSMPNPGNATLQRGCKRYSPRGFTLLELIVVIAILLVLAGLILGVSSSARAKARVTQCKSNLSQLAKAVMQYAAAHDSFYPNVAPRPSLDKSLPTLHDTLMPYIGDGRLLQCPAENLGLFKLEGSSYEWNAILNGKTQDGKIENLLGPSRTPMLYDYESVHPDLGEGSWRGKNVVFCDGSVAQ